MNAFNRRKTSVLLLILVGLAVYFNSLMNGFILGDDTDQVIENTQIRSLSNIPSFFTGSTYFREESSKAFGLYYKPIMMIVYALIFRVADLDPLVFHLVQVVLFIGVGILLLFLFRRFFPPALAWFLAALFIVHPANGESVFFVSALQDILYVLFGLMAVLFLLRSKDVASVRSIAIVSAFLLLSLFSKETGVMFLILSCFIVGFFHTKHLPRFIVLSGLLLLTYSVFRFGIANIRFGEQAIARISQATLAERLMNIPIMLTKYFVLFVYPSHLEIHQNWLVKTFSFREFGLPLVVLSFFFMLLFLLWRRLRTSNHKLLPAFYLFVAWAFVGFLPHMQLIPLDVTFAERWMIAPIVGLLGILGIAWMTVHRRLKSSNMLVAFAVGILILMSVRTVVRSMDWRSSETLFRHDLKTAKDNYYLENLYASLLLEEGKVEEAEPYVRSSIASYPFLSNLSNMAIIHLKQGKLDEAEHFFERSIAKQYIYPAVQNYVNFLIFYKKDYPKAKEVIGRYLPEYSSAGSLWMTLALAEHRLGNDQEAVQASEKAFTLSPSFITEEIYKAFTEGREPDLERYLAK